MAASVINARPMRNVRYTPTLNEKQILYYRAHPVRATKDLLGIQLIWLQRITLRMIWFRRFPLLNLSRGCGKSFIIAIATVLAALLYPGMKIGIIAPVFRQANYVFDYITDFYNSSPYLKEATLKAPSRGSAQSILRFHNGSFIEALPVGDGTKIRGRRYFQVYIDEYAQMDEKIIKLVIRPMLNVKRKGKENKLIVASTSYYRWNHFWTLYLFYLQQVAKGNKDYAVAEFDYMDIVNTPDSPYKIDMDIIKMQQNDMTREEFSMENHGIFPSEGTSFISAKLIDLCTPKIPDPLEPELFQDDKDMGTKYVLGIDCARVAGGDNFAIQALKLDGYKESLVNTFTMNGGTFQEMAEVTRSFVLDFNVIRIHIGAGGGGLTLKDLLSEYWKNRDGEKMLPLLDMDDPEHQHKTGLHIVKVVNESQRKNNELYMNMKAEMQHKRLLFPIDIRSFNKEGKALQRVYSDILATKRELLVLEAIPHGAYHKFTVPSKYKKDRATALVMAVDAAIELRKVEKTEVFGELPVGMWVA